MTTCFSLQETIEMIYDSESDVESNEKSEWNDSESEAIAAMMVTTMERVKAVVWTALMALQLRAMKTDHHKEQVEAVLLDEHKALMEVVAKYKRQEILQRSEARLQVGRGWDRCMDLILS